MYGTGDSSRDVVRVHASPLPNKCSVISERVGEMETKESFMLDACTDCGMAVANGTRDAMENLGYHTSEEFAREWFDNFTKASERWFSKGYVLVNGSEEDDSTFSWSSCDVCKSHLGGSRMSVVAIPM